MKRLFTSFLVITLLACNAQPNKGVVLSPDQFQKNIQTPGIQILDVRTAGEYQSGHIKGALQADWLIKKQYKERVQSLDKNKPVYTYCLSGARSAAAAEWLKDNGFKQVYTLSGGINSWKRAGKPVEGQSDEPQLTMRQYQQLLQKGRPVVLVDFGAEWCPPCKKMEPVIEEVKNTFAGKISFVKVDAGIHTDIMKQLDIPAIPVFIVYKNGKETWRKNGIVSREELTKAIEPALAD